jgi:archaetidylinositol phosphate synthase
VLDSFLDRYVDSIIFIGIIYAGLAEFAGLSSWFWGALALVGSLMVSYMRARAEAAGSGKLAVGIAERGERLLILAIGGLLNYTNYAVVLIVFLTHFTVLHRLLVAWKRLR